MEALAAEFADRAHFPFIYVREAHPGELIPAIQSMEEKAAHAQSFREYGVTRQILPRFAPWPGGTAATGASRT